MRSAIPTRFTRIVCTDLVGEGMVGDMAGNSSPCARTHGGTDEAITMAFSRADRYRHVGRPNGLVQHGARSAQ